MAFTITVRTTSVIVQPGEEAAPLLNPLLELYTYEDEYDEEVQHQLGFIYDEETDSLYLHKGVDLNFIRRLLGDATVVIDPAVDSDDMEFEYEEIIAPKNVEQVDVIDFLACEKQYMKNVDRNQLFLVLGTGKGKMEPISRKIPAPVPKGYIRMGDIKVGDSVFDRYGVPTNVSAIYDHGRQDIYKVTFNDGRYALCGLDHLWYVRRGCDDNEGVVLQTREMLTTFKECNMDAPAGTPHWKYNYYVPKCDAVQYPPREVPIDPWVFGVVMACGYSNDGMILCLKTNNIDVPKRIAKICGYDYRTFRNGDYFFLGKGERSAVSIQTFFSGVPEVIKHGELHRTIPDCYLYNDIVSRLLLLDGLSYHANIDINVYDTIRAVEVCAKYYADNHIVRLIQTMYQSLGYSCIVNSRKHGYEGIVRMLKYIKRSETDLLQITDISFSHQERARCITTDNPEHLYLTENYIVTHNTFCSCTAVCKTQQKTLIITHRDSIRNQWEKTLRTMIGVPQNRIHVFDEAEEFASIAMGYYDESLLDYDIYLITHATFRAALKRVGSFSKMGKIAERLKIGIKLIDEAHLEFKNTLIVDYVLNIKRNIYMTATFGRSSKEEDAIFRHVFSDAVQYVPLDKQRDPNTPNKWVNYVVIELNTHVPEAVYRYRIAGARGMTPATYGKFVIKRDKKATHFSCCVALLREIYERDEHAKVLVFMPLIDLCTEAAYFFNKLNYDDSFPSEISIKTINSKNTKSENEQNKRADVIVTTLGSCGVGTDIPGITDIICCSPYCSKLTAVQVFGRIRYCGKIGTYYDLYDRSVPMDMFWMKARAKKIRPLALNVKALTWNGE
jgi:hypothetical protein